MERERQDERSPGAPTEQGQDDGGGKPGTTGVPAPSLERQLRVLGHRLDQAAASVRGLPAALCQDSSSSFPLQQVTRQEILTEMRNGEKSSPPRHSELLRTGGPLNSPPYTRVGTALTPRLEGAQLQVAGVSPQSAPQK